MDFIVVTLADIFTGNAEAVLKWGVGLFASVIAGAITLLGHRRIQQQDDNHRETHTLELFKALSTPNPQLQLAAASVLIERLKRLKEQSRKSRLDKSEEDSIEYALHSLLKGDAASDEGSLAGRREKSISPQLAKYVAEQLVRLNSAQPLIEGRPPDVERDTMVYAQWRDRVSAPLEPPLKRFDWQKVKLEEVWWPGLDGRGLDFFKAELNDCGMRYANLRDAVFYEARLCGTKLNNADLVGAKFFATNIERTDFRGARLSRADFSQVQNWDKARWQGASYCKETVLPPGLVADDHGMVLVETSPKLERPARSFR